MRQIADQMRGAEAGQLGGEAGQLGGEVGQLGGEVWQLGGEAELPEGTATAALVYSVLALTLLKKLCQMFQR